MQVDAIKKDINDRDKGQFERDKVIERERGEAAGSLKAQSRMSMLAMAVIAIVNVAIALGGFIWRVRHGG